MNTLIAGNGRSWKKYYEKTVPWTGPKTTTNETVNRIVNEKVDGWDSNPGTPTNQALNPAAFTDIH